MSVNVQAKMNYSAVQQQYGLLQSPLLQPTLNAGFSAMSEMSVQAPMGGQINGFASSFQGMNVNPFRANAQFGASMSMGSIGAYGSIGSPALEMAYQSRYSGAQFMSMGNMGSFRGGMGAGAFGGMGGMGGGLPSWMNAANARAASHLRSNEVQAGVQGHNMQLMSDLAQFDQQSKEGIAQLVASGANPTQIAGMMNANNTARRNLITQNRMTMIQEMFETASKISKWGHSTSMSMIQNIKA